MIATGFKALQCLDFSWGQGCLLGCYRHLPSEKVTLIAGMSVAVTVTDAALHTRQLT